MSFGSPSFRKIPDTFREYETGWRGFPVESTVEKITVDAEIEEAIGNVEAGRYRVQKCGLLVFESFSKTLPCVISVHGSLSKEFDCDFTNMPETTRGSKVSGSTTLETISGLTASADCNTLFPRLIKGRGSD